MSLIFSGVFRGGMEAKSGRISRWGLIVVSSRFYFLSLGGRGSYGGERLQSVNFVLGEAYGLYNDGEGHAT
jgi:hypothetical protein